ncbi:SpoIVB peptidase [Syntrophobotulus glycolicus DSM 8271]|uniref:SpoIVB peptidase n=1 Tax=Syntrophobotulus glycolicus (strain DSM 8271 / FlGlyR) TaxID=645991 RepID=F0T085_SYNGF|nr:SpoIVB peptidase [Syntrophobotulus glycolicus]ADY56172.1 SpoIVB peptidase [Syntrophobotulus glycolicus DSM 8271]
MKKYKRRIILFVLLCASLALPPRISMSFPTSISTQSAISFSLFDFFNHENQQPIQSDLRVIPGGQSIGISLRTNGVLIVGYAPIIDSSGKEKFPAKNAGIKIGDMILSINEVKAQNDLQVSEEIDQQCQKNKTINFTIKRGNQILKKQISPVFCSETNRNRIGLFIRDEAAGVGTLTFIEPKQQIFGALGHVITDMDTNEKIELKDGKVIESSISSIEKGKNGDPGEKIGTFMINSNFSGKINKNTESGIYGTLEGKFTNKFYKDGILLGLKSEIIPGPAKIYTVLKNNTIEEFDIEIEKIMLNRNDNKNLIIKITDPKLLDQSGGIVQGMSGSPIVQNQKLIGAVTHVFVNDSTRGYGIFIENMIKDSGLNSSAAAQTGSSFYYLLSYCSKKLSSKNLKYDKFFASYMINFC